MERQYTALKKEVPECILFFRLGDFYEMFGKDAEIAAEILEITLTSRNKNAENPLPMCGIPFKSSEKYLAKLLKAGQKVAIAEQVSDPSLPGIVERKIVRIITPGTAFSESVLDSKKNRFLAAFFFLDNTFSLAFCDLTTGEAFVEIFSDIHAVIRAAQRFEVAELLFSPEHFKEFSGQFSVVSCAVSRHFLPENPEKFLLQFLHTKTLKAFGIDEKKICISAAALLFSFLEDTQKLEISHITGIFLRENTEKMSIDRETLKNLEIFSGSDGNSKTGLFSLLDETKTAMGGRALQRAFVQPFAHKKPIEDRQKKVETLINHEQFFSETIENLKNIADIERILGKLSTGRILPRDFLALQKSLLAVQELHKTLKKNHSAAFAEIEKKLANALEE